MLISIIVPVYNTEKYLKICIDSILSQTYSNFELLLIDDGSTDTSGVICDTYSKEDPRVRVLHKANGGVTSARNLGLEHAQGEWIAFVDSDDRIDKLFLQTMSENISSGVDLIVSAAFEDASLKPQDYINRILKRELRPQIWGNLYRRQVLDGTLSLPRNIFWGEDLISNVLVGLNLRETVLLLDESLYNYNISETSVSRNRKSTLEYEEYFLHVLQTTMGENNVRIYSNALNFTKLYILEDLIVCRQNINYDRLWVKELMEWARDQNLTFRQKIVLAIRNNWVCRYALAIERRFSQLLFTVRNGHRYIFR